jgi:hypothetical protein
MKQLLKIVALAAFLALPFGYVASAEGLPPGLTAQAIASAKTPAEHEAIAAAYTKEAEDLRAKANEHRAMDKQYSGPGYRSLKLGAGMHCKKLVEAYEAAAKDSDSLAAMHRDMAKAAGEKK